jgi:hypothetical protein
MISPTDLLHPFPAPHYENRHMHFVNWVTGQAYGHINSLLIGFQKKKYFFETPEIEYFRRKDCCGNLYQLRTEELTKESGRSSTRIQKFVGSYPQPTSYTTPSSYVTSTAENNR